jgi:hypothetical protein
MRNIFGTIAVLVSASAYAGGTVGGNPGLVKEQLALEFADSAFNVEALPKTYIGGEDFRRIRARLSVDGTDSIPATIGDEIIQVRKLKNSIVDTKISKEILQEGGAVGGNPVAP